MTPHTLAAMEIAIPPKSGEIMRSGFQGEKRSSDTQGMAAQSEQR